MIEFGIRRVAGGNIGGALCIDDVEAECIDAIIWFGLPNMAPPDIDTLPAVPNVDGAEVVPFYDQPSDPPDDGPQQGLFFFILAGGLMLYAMLRVLSGNRSE